MTIPVKGLMALAIDGARVHTMLTFRSSLILAVRCSVGFALGAQARQLKPTDYALQIVTDRAAPYYHRGETVTFTISLTKKGELLDGEKVKWEISKDGVKPPLKQGVVTLGKGVNTTSARGCYPTGPMRSPDGCAKH